MAVTVEEVAVASVLVQGSASCSAMMVGRSQQRWRSLLVVVLSVVVLLHSGKSDFGC